MRLCWQPCDINSTEARLVSFLFSFRVLLCMSWDPDRWRITNVFDSCHDVKQNTWPSICFPPVPLGKRSAGVRDYCYYSTHSSALAQCPTTINPHERPIGRSDIFHGHPPSAIRMKQRDSQLSRELLHELLKNKESSSTLSPPKKNNSNQKHFRRVCVCATGRR
jgi:hypothetical protein